MQENKMKFLKSVLFCMACVLVFALAAVATSSMRAGRWVMPKLRANLAYSYASLFGDYAFLQYNQADTEQAKAALLDYLGILQKIRRQGTQYPERTLHRDLGITYLRLYRLNLAANRPSEAMADLKSAQEEFSGGGLKDFSAESLVKQLDEREAGEAKLYNNDASAAVAVTGQKP